MSDTQRGAVQRSIRFTMPFACRITSIGTCDLPKPIELKAGEVAVIFEDGSYTVSVPEPLSDPAALRSRPSRDEVLEEAAQEVMKGAGIVFSADGLATVAASIRALKAQPAAQNSAADAFAEQV